MSDLVVTVPKTRWQEWLGEGTWPGQACQPDVEYHWFGRGRHLPPIRRSDRLYIVAHGRLRGYAPVVRLDAPPYPKPDWWWPGADWAIVRQGGAVAVTIPGRINGFQGWRYRWWNRGQEIPFPDWQTADMPVGMKVRV